MHRMVGSVKQDRFTGPVADGSSRPRETTTSVLERWPRVNRVVTALLVAGVLVTSWVLLVRLVGPVRFYQDDWAFIGRRYEFSVEAILAPHSGHPSMLPALSFLLGFRLFGLHDLRYYKTVLVVVHMATAVAIARRVWRRHGPEAALAAWCIFCFLGAGAENIIWLFQIGLIGGVLFFVLACDAFERLRISRRRRDGALVAFLLCCAVMCSMVGAAAIAALGAVILLDRDRRRNWWIPVVPSALLAVWWFAYDPSTGRFAELSDMVDFLWEAIRTSGAAVLLGNEFLGVALVAGLFLLAGLWWRRDRDQTQLLAGLLFVCAFWGSITMGRSNVYTLVGVPSPQRFKYVAAAGILVALADLLPPSRRARHRLVRAGAVLALAAGTVMSGLDDLIDTRNEYARASVSKAAELTVIDAHPDAFPDDMLVWMVVGDRLATVGQYRRAARSTGTTAGLTSDELVVLPDGLQRNAEALMLPLLAVETAPVDSCALASENGRAFRLPAGTSVTVVAEGDAVLVASRWLPADPSGSGRHALPAGWWTVAAPGDELEPDWTLTFAGDVRVGSCGG